MSRIAVIVVLAAALAVGTASGPRTASADTTAPSVYTDPSGDSATAPDLTKVVLTPGSGTVAVDLTFTGTLGSDGSLLVLIDSDRNPQTGSQGVDYIVLATGGGLGFGKWDGTSFSTFAHQPTNPILNGADLTFTITLADIGGVTTFDFIAGSLRGNDADSVPDSGVATYPVAVVAPPPPPPPPPTPPPVKVKALMVPGTVLIAKAGKVLRVPKLRVLLTDGTTAATDSQSCVLRAKGKKLAPLAGGCAWKIPKTYRKARLAVTVTYTYDGVTGSRSWTIVPS